MTCWPSIQILASSGETWHKPLPVPVFPLHLGQVFFYIRSYRLTWANLDLCLLPHALCSPPGVESPRGANLLLHLWLLGPRWNWLLQPSTCFDGWPLCLHGAQALALAVAWERGQLRACPPPAICLTLGTGKQQGTLSCGLTALLPDQL